MNYIKHLAAFFDKIIQDSTLNPTHISIYMALFQCWNCNRFRNPISISRDEIMQISKISSKATYHKCLKNLHNSGYIKYEPSFNPFKGSHVTVYPLSAVANPEEYVESTTQNEPLRESVAEPVVNKNRTTATTGSEQAVVSSINNTNSTNSKNSTKETKENGPVQKIEKINSIAQEEDPATKEKKLPQKKKGCPPPELTEIVTYFQSRQYPQLEAQKFHNYFSSIGWLVGGKTPMLNWQAAAENWMLNSQNFNTTPQTLKPNQLNATTSKNYDEPL
ncbi:transcriptional regulator [Flavobacterium orientale]|uniref:transcriptional regulator n=1 Tax=Flavobacterium orientale TaxID=1756020 RepID=UPI001663CFF0|nr:transcriptional regulator [Flavobacterium orientale]